MKFPKAGIAAITLLLTLGANAHAQEVSNPGHGYLSIDQDRSPEEQACDKLMREVAFRMEQARQEINTALPIYNGHREKALEHSDAAYLEIRKALMWDHMYTSPSKPESAGYGWPVPEEQARRSHEHLVTASRLLTEAASYMEQVKLEYGGYRRRALASTRKALEHLQDALRSA